MTDTPTSAAAAAGADDRAVPADIAALSFDKALDELRDVVARLEHGSLPLEESIALYERGALLHQHCSELLDAAELRVQRLVDDSRGGDPRVVDMRPDDGDDL